MITKSIQIAFLSFILAACGDLEASRQVNWTHYSPIVKQRIDKATAAKDCRALQVEFDSADKNSDSQRGRTGVSNANLMHFVDKKMQAANCYKQ